MWHDEISNFLTFYYKAVSYSTETKRDLPFANAR